MPEDQIYIKSEVNGKMVKVSCIFTSVEETNRYLESNQDEGVIYQIDNTSDGEELIFVAKNEDIGRDENKLPSKLKPLLKQLFRHHKSQARPATSPVSKIYHAELASKLKRIIGGLYGINI
jgi:hypothetical protein